MIKPGDRVILTDRIPLGACLFLRVAPGWMGTMVRFCDCMGAREEIAKLGLEQELKEMGPIARVAFDNDNGIKTCLLEKWLEKLADVKDDDKMVDWSKVPKPWEIGVTDRPKEKA